MCLIWEIEARQEGMRKLKDNRGVTFVELMTIVLLIGVVSAMAAPQFAKTARHLRFRTAARDVVSKMRLARSNAVANKQQYGVQLNQSDKTLTMFYDKINPSSYQFESGDSVITVDTFPDDFVLVGSTFGNPSVIFRPTGSASATGFFYLLAISHEDDIGFATVDVLASTGRTKIGNLWLY